MSDEDPEVTRRQLLQELARLDIEQQMLDLRDAEAVAACHRKIEKLRERIGRLRPSGQPDRPAADGRAPRRWRSQ